MALEPEENQQAFESGLAPNINDKVLKEDEEADEKEIESLEKEARGDTNDALLSLETLRESPVQWPEKLPGMTDFLTMSDTPIHMPNIENSQELTSEEVQEIIELGSLTPEELVSKIKALHDEVYQLGSREAKEMTRGKLLGIFSRIGRKK